jgi:hypothetical protein
MFHPGNYEGAGKSRTKTIWQALNREKISNRNGDGWLDPAPFLDTCREEAARKEDT